MNVLANIVETLSLDPRYINFGKIKKGSQNQQEILITNKGKSLIAITEISVKPEGLARVSPRDECTLGPGEFKKLVLSINPTKNKGSVYGTLSFHTNLEYLPQNSIRFRAQIIAE
ncbi:MAG: DUF1573 domain-containing protein [Deltaproteobacteria bacterium]|nr:DUF1573 domain-containing protein [Deltaproteobacteria bacterium]